MNTWLGINLWPSSKDPSSSSSDPRSSPPSPSSTSNDADVVVVVVVVVVVRVVDFFGGNRPRLKVKAPPSSRGSSSAAARSDVIVVDVVVVVDAVDGVSRLTFCLRAPNPLAFSTSSTYSSSLIKSDLSSASSSSSSPPKIPIPVSSSLSGLCFSESEAPKASCRPGPWDEILGPDGLYKRSH